MFRRRRDLRVSHDDERLRHEQPDALRAQLSRLRHIDSFERGMIPYVVRRVAMRRLPHQLAAIEIDR